jgi:hypothetical protein
LSGPSDFLVRLVQANTLDTQNKPEQAAEFRMPRGKGTACEAGGGFQHMLVDSHHICSCRVTTRRHFTGKFKPLPHVHDGTSLALHVE